MENKYNEKIYHLSKTAKQLIENNYLYIINKNKNYCFTEGEIKRAYQEAPKWASNNDIIWGMFNKKNLELENDKDWGLYRNNLHNMGNLLYEEKKYSQSLTFFLVVFTLDISGMENGNYVKSINSLFTAPAITKTIKNLLIICDLTKEELYEIFQEATIYYNIMLPFNYYSVEIGYKILLDCLDDKKLNFQKYEHKNPIENSNKYNYYNFEAYNKN